MPQQYGHDGDPYRATLTDAEQQLYDARNALDPYDAQQLARRMAVEQSLSTVQLARWEAAYARPASALGDAMRGFDALCAEADARAKASCSIVSALPCDEGGYHRRYPDNLAADARLVDTCGRVGAGVFDAATFCNAVLTHSPDAAPAGVAGVIQVQGCDNAPGFDTILSMATSYAGKAGVRRVVLANMAGGQIPPYFKFVPHAPWATEGMRLTGGHARMQRASGGRLFENTYLEYSDWPDGLLVPPHVLQALAGEVCAALLQDAPAVLVIGCNAGKDRSGLVNALVQLELSWRAHGVPGAVVNDVLRVTAAIQQGRPEALRTPERFKLLFFAAEALAARLEATPVGAGTHTQAQVAAVAAARRAR